ncbi:MAG: anaerobic ribonucleoside-triphosphate reductase activating protein [Ruminococcaceae bacterium]|nr:anaerobic ribonucleoside-triphosphate reductase activating protein [Oscillospiraceae bacterium]
MQIKGLQKTTLLDYPGKVACTLFTGGCNFRCPFCHNASLVLSPNDVTDISEEEFFKFLEKRVGVLDGVCITGGEPLLQHDIIPFMEKIHALGFAIKLDTNGSRPKLLREIVELGLVDHIAMDIKNAPEKYPLTAGTDLDFDTIKKSIDFIMNCGVSYEFRTTVVKELHSLDDMASIGRLISGAQNYYLQSFKDSGDLICPEYSAHSEETMHDMLSAVKPYVKNAELRGI